MGMKYAKQRKFQMRNIISLSLVELASPANIKKQNDGAAIKTTKDRAKILDLLIGGINDDIFASCKSKPGSYYFRHHRPSTSAQNPADS
jgi:hypothetical protein